MGPGGPGRAARRFFGRPIMDPMSALMRDLRRIEVGRQRDAELELIRRAQAGDIAARNELVEGLLPFVMCQARLRHRSGPRADLTDSFQAGCLGVLRAIESFNPAKGCRLITYAGAHIHRAIENHRLDNLAGAHVPRGSYSSPSMSPETRTKIKLLASQHSTTELHWLPSKTQGPQDEAAEREEERGEHLVAMRRAILALEDRLRLVVEARLRGMTFREIAATMGITRQRAHQLFAEAQARLRGKLAAAGEQAGPQAPGFTVRRAAG